MLIGGRGKAGGVKVVRTPEELSREAGRILGMNLRGLKVSRVLITPSAEIAREYYAGMVLDRRNELPVLMVSPEGGIDIEEVARERPEKLLKIPVDLRGLPHYRARAAARFLDKDPAIQSKIASILRLLAGDAVSVGERCHEQCVHAAHFLHALDHLRRALVHERHGPDLDADGRRRGGTVEPARLREHYQKSPLGEHDAITAGRNLTVLIKELGAG